jgi:hypothetical protein
MLMPVPIPHIVIDVSTDDPLSLISLHHVLMAHTVDALMVHGLAV